MFSTRGSGDDFTTAGRDVLLGAIAAYSVVLIVCACSPKGGGASGSSGSTPIVTDCELPSSEQFSIQGHWAGTQLPVKVSLHAGDFNPTETSSIQAAGGTWNTFMSAVHPFTMFDLGPAGGYQSSATQSSPSCQTGTIPDGTVLYKRFSGWAHNQAAIAVTTTCFTPSTTGGLPTIYNAIMEFNYVNFFIQSSNKFPDMQSVALHELGHLLGLDHSCGPLGAPNQNEPNVACPDQSSDSSNPLFTTVMFPNFFFDPSTGASNVQQQLSTNDEGRANCAYQGIQ